MKSHSKWIAGLLAMLYVAGYGEVRMSHGLVFDGVEVGTRHGPMSFTPHPYEVFFAPLCMLEGFLRAGH